MMKDEWRMMKDEGWMMKDDDFKLLWGFADWLTDRRTDICECRVAFATEIMKSIYIFTKHISIEYLFVYKLKWYRISFKSGESVACQDPEVHFSKSKFQQICSSITFWNQLLTDRHQTINNHSYYPQWLDSIHHPNIWISDLLSSP